MENNTQPSYYAVIPANVRYDKRLNPSARLLYGEIAALTNHLGYCYANNSYFAELYDKSKATISSWINQLVEFGYITSEIIYKDDSKEIQQRRLRIAVADPIQENLNTPSKNLEEATPKNLKDNNTRYNNTKLSKVEPSLFDEEEGKLKPPKRRKLKKPIDFRIPVEIRKQQFIEKVKQFIDKYDRDMLNDFILHWTQYDEDAEQPIMLWEERKQESAFQIGNKLLTKSRYWKKQKEKEEKLEKKFSDRL